MHHLKLREINLTYKLHFLPFQIQNCNSILTFSLEVAHLRKLPLCRFYETVCEQYGLKVAKAGCLYICLNTLKKYLENNKSIQVFYPCQRERIFEKKKRKNVIIFTFFVDLRQGYSLYMWVERQRVFFR